MITSPEFQSPLRYDAIADHSYDALLLPGGHAEGVMPYLESTLLHSTVREFFARGKAVGAICHGVVLAARSTAASGKSVLYGRKTTALLRSQELLAWNLTRLYLGDYYRTYPTTVEDEVTAALAQPGDFQHGPLAIARDTPDRPNGFAVIDDNYVRRATATQDSFRGRPCCSCRAMGWSTAGPRRPGRLTSVGKMSKAMTLEVLNAVFAALSRIAAVCASGLNGWPLTMPIAASMPRQSASAGSRTSLSMKRDSIFEIAPVSREQHVHR